MSRLRSLLLLGGTVLVMSYISAPAAPTPAPPRPSDEQVRAIHAAAPIVDSAEQEAAQLRARLAVVPPSAEPRRDPFSFGSKPREPKRVETSAPPSDPPVEMPAPPPLVWPKLVALLTDNGKVTAVLGIGDAVEMLEAGEAAGGFLVREITASSIEVVHVATSVATRLTLR